MVEVHGFCDERFAAIGDQFRAGLEDGSDEGASYAIDLNGHLVVDLWGGYRDVARSQPWESDTLVRVASTSKMVVALATLMVWDRGLIDLDAPIAIYWPEFAQNGKAAITTRQVLVQQAGVPGFGRVVTFEEAADWARMVAVMEQAAVWYEPGTRSAYHAFTFGYILGELVRRVSGRPFAQFVVEEITQPLGADFHFAITEPADTARIAEIWPPSGALSETSMGERILAEFNDVIAGLFLDPGGPAVVVPAASGISNARAIARVGSIISQGGEVDGDRYLSRRTVDEVAQEQCFAEDEAIGERIRRGLFFALDHDSFRAPTPTAIHWGGAGGSWVSMDPASGITCAYAPNRFLSGDELYARQRVQWQVLMDVLPTVR
jgi:CubicO group peptidase (beta-lactamase class C family)